MIIIFIISANRSSLNPTYRSLLTADTPLHRYFFQTNYSRFIGIQGNSLLLHFSISLWVIKKHTFLFSKHIFIWFGSKNSTSGQQYDVGSLLRGQTVSVTRTGKTCTTYWSRQFWDISWPTTLNHCFSTFTFLWQNHCPFYANPFWRKQPFLYEIAVLFKGVLYIFFLQSCNLPSFYLTLWDKTIFSTESDIRHTK